MLLDALFAAAELLVNLLVLGCELLLLVAVNAGAEATAEEEASLVRLLIEGVHVAGGVITVIPVEAEPQLLLQWSNEALLRVIHAQVLFSHGFHHVLVLELRLILSVEAIEIERLGAVVAGSILMVLVVALAGLRREREALLGEVHCFLATLFADVDSIDRSK